MRINSTQFKRFEKQIILKKVGIAGQKKIFSSRVLILGMGGLGCPLITYLAAAGVGEIGIVDYDKVEVSNLSRQTLFRTCDIGKSKVKQVKNLINKFYKKIKVIPIERKISKKNIDNILKNFEIICDGTDNYETRYIINDYCKKNKKILITSAINKFDGHLMKFNFKKRGPCFRCFMPTPPLNENNCQQDGLFSPVAGIMGSLLSNEVLKTILNYQGDLSGKIVIFNSIKLSLKKLKISIDNNCLNKC